MASKSSSLRHIEVSGGLFTENILLRLRDKPDQLTIGKIESFIEKDTKLLRNQFKKKRMRFLSGAATLGTIFPQLSRNWP